MKFACLNPKCRNKLETLILSKYVLVFAFGFKLCYLAYAVVTLAYGTRKVPGVRFYVTRFQQYASLAIILAIGIIACIPQLSGITFFHEKNVVKVNTLKTNPDMLASGVPKTIDILSLMHLSNTRVNKS
jgi:hypothetical protein